MLATHLLDTIPAIMNEWRKVMNDGLPQGLTVNQYRVLYFVSSGFESQCLMAKHLGVTAAAMSKMVDGLVAKKMVTRKGHSEDRRHIILSISSSGRKVVNQMRLQVEKRMQTHLDVLNSTQQKEIEKALITLQSVFSVIGEK